MPELLYINTYTYTEAVKLVIFTTDKEEVSIDFFI